MSTNSYKNYLKEEHFPHIWCPGCGDGIVLHAYAIALAELGLAPKEVVTVTGIGCWGKSDDYVATHALHGTHGRALAYATGVKLGNPVLTVIALMGDGDAVTIGGNHFIHAARRNIDLTAVVINNFNYGMTGGQYSATTPLKSKTTTSPLGNAEPGFDICSLAEAAGANFVARTTPFHVVSLKNLLKEGIQKKGFSLIEVITPCPTYFGRYNINSSPVANMHWLKDKAVSVSRYQHMTDEDKLQHFAIGTFVNKDRPDFYTMYQQINDCKWEGGR
ncbi:MAG TPA: 2-oxoacid:ferredoxin oxidoreductase subunit beta [Desulfosporosinus sp.]|nr:2-oxoacid:ferredoxin oxidoreductase subunit beta [Desulfosporosinus sp.]